MPLPPVVLWYRNFGSVSEPPWAGSTVCTVTPEPSTSEPPPAQATRFTSASMMEVSWQGWWSVPGGMDGSPAASKRT